MEASIGDTVQLSFRCIDESGNALFEQPDPSEVSVLFQKAPSTS